MSTIKGLRQQASYDTEKHDNFPCVLFLTLKVNYRICGNNVISYACISGPPYKPVSCNLVYIPHFPFCF